MQGGSGWLPRIVPQDVQPFQHPGETAVERGRGGELRRGCSGDGQGPRRPLDESAPCDALQDRAPEGEQVAARA